MHPRFNSQSRPQRPQPLYRRLGCFLPLLLTLTLLGLTAELTAAAECPSRGGPGATLLFPYVEVDLANAQGRTTLISIQNTSAEPVLTNVVLWTNCGVPALSFPLAIGADGLQSIDVRRMIGGGRIPNGGVDAAFPGCAVPLAPADLGAQEIFDLRTRLTGQPNSDGMCFALPGEIVDLAIGFLTVDVVKKCSETVRTPLDAGYFATDGAGGIASSANVLWGDVFLVDALGNLAQGFEAVAVVADSSVAEASEGSFYGLGDDRQEPATRYRTRLIQGGAFDGGTELLTWVRSWSKGPVFCEAYACVGGFTGFGLGVTVRNESGKNQPDELVHLRTLTSRLRVGSEDLPIATLFGSLDAQFYFYPCKSGKCTPPNRNPTPGWLLPLYTAEGRYSVGLQATALDDSCSE